MSIHPDSLTVASLPSKWAGASSDVVKAIRSASKATGVSFDYLMDKAKTESAFDPDVKAKTSSATGLYQFIDSTWLATLREHGAKYGLDDLVGKIDSDPSARQEALDLRKDPTVAAVMTAEATKDNQYYLETSVGGAIGKNELYLAHFLGLGGATKFLKAKNDNPMAPAADLFPSAANANKNVFFDASGKKKSLDEVYAFFAKKMDETEGNAAVAVAASVAGKGANDPLSLAFSKPDRIAKGPSSLARQSLPVSGQSLLSSIDAAMTARLGGIAAPDQTGPSHAALATTATASPDHFQQDFFRLALGQSGNAEKTLLGEGSLISPFTTMIMAKLATVRDAQDGDKS